MRAYSLSQIYTSGGAIPAIEYPLAAPVFGTISPPRSQARLMGHTPFFFESWYNVERTVTLSVVGFAALRRERGTEEEGRGAIRAEGVTRVEDVDAVTMENDGTLTVAWMSKKPGETSLVDAKDPDPEDTA